MIKDGGTNPPTTCKIAAQQLAADSDIVGVVGAMRSSCSKASHQYFRDNGKQILAIITETLTLKSNIFRTDRVYCCLPLVVVLNWIVAIVLLHRYRRYSLFDSCFE